LHDAPRGKPEYSMTTPFSERRKYLPLVAGLGGLALVVAVVVLRISKPDAAAAVPMPAMSVTAVTLQASNVARAITANGSVHPWQEVIISPEVGGYRVAAVNVDVGDRVRRGQELVRLSDAMLQSDLTSKRANLQSTEASLANASAAYARAQSLSASGVLSKADLDKLLSEELTARARVEVAKAEVAAAQLRLSYTRVTAPDDGVVFARTVAVGQTASVGGEMLRMVRRGRLEWRAEIPEARMREIKAGQAVKLTTADGSILAGKVRTVAPVIDSTTRSGLVYVDIESDAARAGMFARGELVLAQQAAQMVPIACVIIQDGYSYVFVVTEQQTVQRRRVETGMVKDSAIEIVSGIDPGERVVEKGAGFLKDGEKVSVVTSAAGDAE
jgi:RND family efflux transporter MFP subunit